MFPYFNAVVSCNSGDKASYCEFRNDTVDLKTTQLTELNKYSLEKVYLSATLCR